jgi:hypothetical protein
MDDDIDDEDEDESEDEDDEGTQNSRAAWGMKNKKEKRIQTWNN